MFPRKIRVCELFGIPIYLDFSLIILLVMFVMDFGSFTYGLSFALALAVSITLHELGHSLTARIFGYNAREITLSLLGGCASFINLPRKASQEFLTALAGPIVSFAIAGPAVSSRSQASPGFLFRICRSATRGRRTCWPTRSG